MKNFEELEEFVSTHENWYELLKATPYNLKSIKQCEWMPELWIFNYNLFNSDLSLPIVKQCRGTVLSIIDGKATTVCGPYTKFFNYGDPNCAEIDWESASFYEKVDGQLIKAFSYKGYIFWISNGDFMLNANLTRTSSTIKDYKDLLFTAICKPYMDKTPAWYRPLLAGKNPFEVCNLPWLNNIPSGWTLMFELCSPYNKIIVDHKDIKLWFHGARDAEGNEWLPEEAAQKFGLPYDIPQRFNFSNMEEASKVLDKWNGLEHEGFVVCDKNFNRVKVKGVNYLNEKFKREFTESLNRDDVIFKLIIDESYDDILPTHPEIKEHIDYLLERITTLKNKVIEYGNEAIEMGKRLPNKKDFSQWVMLNHPKLSSIYFGANKVGNAEQYFNNLFDKKIRLGQGYEYKHFMELELLVYGSGKRS